MLLNASLLLCIHITPLRLWRKICNVEKFDISKCYRCGEIWSFSTCGAISNLSTWQLWENHIISYHIIDCQDALQKIICWLARTSCKLWQPVTAYAFQESHHTCFFNFCLEILCWILSNLFHVLVSFHLNPDLFFKCLLTNTVPHCWNEICIGHVPNTWYVTRDSGRNAPASQLQLKHKYATQTK